MRPDDQAPTPLVTAAANGIEFDPVVRARLACDPWAPGRRDVVVARLDALVWRYGLYTVACSCGSAGPWTLVAYDVERGYVEDPQWERHADAMCESCGAVNLHPLVYPEFVAAVAEWIAAGNTPESQPRAIADWRPHRLVLPPRDPRDLAGMYVGAGWWESWDRMPAHLRHERWPDLARADDAWQTVTQAAGIGPGQCVPREFGERARLLLTELATAEHDEGRYRSGPSRSTSRRA